MPIDLCFLALTPLLNLSIDKAQIQSIGHDLLTSQIYDSLEPAWRRVLLFLSVQDLCILEKVSRSMCMAVRYYAYEPFAKSLIENLGLYDVHIPTSLEWDLINPRWATIFGLKYHLILLRMAKLNVCQIEGSRERLRLEDELQSIRNVCEFLKEQGTIDKFSDPKTIRMLNTVLQLTSEHNTVHALSRGERLALTCLRIGLGKLTNSPLPSDIANAIDIAEALGEPYEDPKRFFHTLLTELSKWVTGLRRLQKESSRCYRELLFYRHTCSGSLLLTKRSLIVVRDAAIVYQLDTKAFMTDLGRMDRIEYHQQEIQGFCYFHPDETALLTRILQRRHVAENSQLMLPLPSVPDPRYTAFPIMAQNPGFRMVSQPTLPEFNQPYVTNTNHMSQSVWGCHVGQEPQSAASVADSARSNPCPSSVANATRVMQHHDDYFNPALASPGPQGLYKPSPHSVASLEFSKDETGRPSLHPSLMTGSYSYFEPRSKKVV